jgi:hypothetical protein
MMLSRDDAAAEVAERTAERDKIQANLLDLDGSFGKRLLTGAALAGITKSRWQEASAELATLWEMYTAYSAVIDRAAEYAQKVARRGRVESDLGELAALLSGPSVRVARPLAPLARRSLIQSSDEQITIAAAVREMTAAFGRVAAVVTAAETVWNELTDRLESVTTELSAADREADGLADEALAGQLGAATAELAALRGALGADPLSFWQAGRAGTTRLDRLEQQVADAMSVARELALLRADADRRLAAATRAVAAAQAAEQDAVAARGRAAAKVVAAALPALPASLAGTGDAVKRLAALDVLRSQGRWRTLAAELAAIEGQAATVTEAFRAAERAAAALLARRGELRSLLDGYRAKADRLGGAEDPDLTARYEKARELLWVAPCDLVAAADAVTSYQQAVMTFTAGRRAR